jgi:hypothetical protein
MAPPPAIVAPRSLSENPLKKNAWHENSILDTCDRVHLKKMKEIEKQTEGADEPEDAIPAV